MDFHDSAADAAFRAEVSAWLDAVLADVPPQDDLDQTERERWSRLWQQRLSESGWNGMSWPAEYGGKGLDVVSQAIFNEEGEKRGAPYALNGVGVSLAGPTIMTHGTAEQKQRYLPRILASEDYWCQGFSEPGSGSDLASLRTAAVKVDGGWRITGEKVWTSNAHNADRCLLLARTDPSAAPKHAGITYFLAEMAGVQVSPLTMINGDAEFNQMHFDGLFVADHDVLGGVGGGWQVALTTLAYERGTMALNLWVWARQAVDRAVALAHERRLTDDDAVVDQIGSLHADAEAVRIGSLRLMGEMQAGRTPGPETSALKLQWAAVVQAANRLGVQLNGSAGVLVEDGQAPATRLRHYLRSRAHTIEGGTDEVQKSILAERVLALPRSR